MGYIPKEFTNRCNKMLISSFPWYAWIGFILAIAIIVVLVIICIFCPSRDKSSSRHDDIPVSSMQSAAFPNNVTFNPSKTPLLPPAPVDTPNSGIYTQIGDRTIINDHTVFQSAEFPSVTNQMSSTFEFNDEK